MYYTLKQRYVTIVLGIKYNQTEETVKNHIPLLHLS